MFDFFVTALLSLLAVFPTFGSQGIQQLQQWRATEGRVELASSTAGLRIPSLASLDCVGTDGDGDFGAGTCTGGPGGGLSAYDAWTHPQAGTSATTSGMIFSASSSIARLSSVLSTSTNATSTNLHISSLFSFAGDIFDELVGDGLALSSGDLIFDCSDVAGTGITCSGEDITASLGIAIDTSEITDDTILEADLDLVDAAGDENILTSEGTGFEWHTFTELCEAEFGNSELCDGDDASGAGGSGSVATSTNEVANQVAFFTSNSATPALIGGDADFIWDGSNNILTLGQGGAGSSTMAFGPDVNNQWLIGYDGDDKSFAIASSTALGVLNALTINHATLATTLSSLTLGSPLGFASGGLGADVSGYTTGIFGMIAGVATDIDTVGEIETIVGSQNILLETEIDGCSELAGLLDAETGGCNGTSGPVFPDGPTFIGLATFARSTTSLASFDYASSTLYFGAGLGTCETGNMLTWASGRFGCEADDEGVGGGGAEPFPSLATTSLLTFTNGLIAGASTTLNNFTGLNATTTLLQFPSGGVMGWNNGDLLLTHTSNLLTLSGGAFAVGNGTITSVAGGITIAGSGGGAFNVTDQVYTGAIDVAGLLTSSSGVNLGGSTFLEIPNGTNPTANDVGEIAHDTTDNQLILDDLVIATGVQKIWSTTVASTSPIFIAASTLSVPTELDGYTITAIRCKVDGGTSKVIAVEDASGNSSEDITCATTVTSDDGSITNAAYTAAEEAYIDFGATTGVVDTVSISVFGTWTRE